jgi:hypothetical protein
MRAYERSRRIHYPKASGQQRRRVRRRPQLTSAQAQGQAQSPHSMADRAKAERTFGCRDWHIQRLRCSCCGSPSGRPQQLQLRPPYASSHAARPSQRQTEQCQGLLPGHAALGRPAALRRAASAIICAHCGAMRTRSSPGCRGLGPALRDVQTPTLPGADRQARRDRAPTLRFPSKMGTDGAEWTRQRRLLCTENTEDRIARVVVALIKAVRACSAQTHNTGIFTTKLGAYIIINMAHMHRDPQPTAAASACTNVHHSSECSYASLGGA